MAVLDCIDRDTRKGCRACAERDGGTPVEKADRRSWRDRRCAEAPGERNCQEPGGQRDLRRKRDDERGRHAEGQRLCRGDVRPRAAETKQQRITDRRGRQREEREQGSPACAVRRQLVGEASRDESRLAEPSGVAAFPQVIGRLREDPPAPRPTDADFAELDLQLAEEALVHATTASTAFVNPRQSRFAPANARRPRAVSR